MTEQKVLELIREYTGHKRVHLTARGNAAILTAISIAKKINPKPFFLIPDQGGWISFETYPQLFGFEIRKVKTNRGIIDLIDLEKKAEGGSALIMTSFAGYFAEQDMKYIAKICHDHDCLLIEDCSGALADPSLANGENADILVSSFGKWKVIDNHYGGFISVKDIHLDRAAETILSATNFFPAYDQLLVKLKKAPKLLEAYYVQQQKIKEQMKEEGINAFHPEKKGLNVVAGFRNEEEKEKIIKFCEKRKIEFVECPKYIRVEEQAISLELKRGKV